MGNTDILIRTITDIIWVGSNKARAWQGGDIRKIYYGLLVGFTVWWMIAVNWGNAMTLFKFLANVAGFVLAIAGIQVLMVNTRLLPRELQAPMWRKAALVLCSVFYTIISIMVAWTAIESW